MLTKDKAELQDDVEQACREAWASLTKYQTALRAAGFEDAARHANLASRDLLAAREASPK